MKPRLRLQAAGQTDIGQKSDQNEDAIFYEVAQQETAALLIVADGMGGHLAGEVASQIVTETVADAMRPWLAKEDVATSENVGKEVENAVYTAVQQANQNVYDYSQEKLGEGANMGSTVACIFVHQNKAYIANVGDSRAYLCRQREMHRLTEDHSLVERFVQEGIITDDERYDHPSGNVVTRAIGPRLDVGVDLFTCDLKAGDYLLLCSDGLWEMIRGDDFIMQQLQSQKSLNEICQNLINMANKAGGKDNISVVLAKVLPA